MAVLKPEQIDKAALRIKNGFIVANKVVLPWTEDGELVHWVSAFCFVNGNAKDMAELTHKRRVQRGKPSKLFQVKNGKPKKYEVPILKVGNRIAP